MLILPRLFYGRKASRLLDKEEWENQEGATVLNNRDMAGLDSTPNRLMRAYSRATNDLDFAGRPRDPTEFREVAEEE